MLSAARVAGHSFEHRHDRDRAEVPGTGRVRERGDTCGLVAGFVDGAAQVTLRNPPRLGRPLTVTGSGEGIVTVGDGNLIVAEAGPISFDLDPPPPPTPAEAATASTRYAGFLRHAFPECFVCGTARAEGDGLRIYAGQVEGREVWADDWIPAESLPRDGVQIAREIVWAALDCPGAWAVERAAHDRPVVLGRMAARIDGAVLLGNTYVVTGWPIAAEGRKLFAGTALYDEQGNLVAAARQTWIVLEG